MPKVKDIFKKVLYPWQLKALDAALNNKDVFVTNHTGAGKSLIFQSLCLKYSKAIVLVIVPINAIIRD